MTSEQKNHYQDEKQVDRSAHIGRYVLIGALTVAPLAVTLMVFEFLLRILARTGEPLLKGLARIVRPHSDVMAS